MLVLMRRPGESIKIGNSITVAVVGFVGAGVRIGVNAPRDISVDRKEVRERKRAERVRRRQAHGR